MVRLLLCNLLKKQLCFKTKVDTLVNLVVRMVGNQKFTLLILLNILQTNLYAGKDN